MGLFNTKIAAIQYKIIFDNKEENLKNATDYILESIKCGAEIICLPETFATGLNFPSIKRMAEEDNGEIITTIKNLAKEHKVHIIGSFLEKKGRDIFDTAFIAGNKGNILGKYHRCSLWLEERNFFNIGQPGHVINTKYGPIGLIVGYDIRFPISCHNYFLEKPLLVVCPINSFVDYGFPVKSICRARAADTICYFVLASGLGFHKFVNSNYMGKSLIIDGKIENLYEKEDADVLAEAGTKDEIIYADLNFKKMKKFQQRPATLYYTDYDACWKNYCSKLS